MLTAYGVVVVSFMMVMYALERRDGRFVFASAIGCTLSSSYGFRSGAWRFGSSRRSRAWSHSAAIGSSLVRRHWQIWRAARRVANG